MKKWLTHGVAFILGGVASLVAIVALLPLLSWIEPHAEGFVQSTNASHIVIDKQWHDSLLGDRTIKIKANISPAEYAAFLEYMRLDATHREANGLYRKKLQDDHEIIASYLDGYLIYEENVW